MSKEIKAAVIGGICVIIAAIIGIFNFSLNNSNEILEQKNTELSEQNSDWEIAYNELNEQFDELNNQNTSLSNEINTLKDSMEQYSSLVDENESLKNEISELKNEIAKINSSEPPKKKEDDSNPESDDSSNNNAKKVSIFDLDTFQGYDCWGYPYDENYYTDTYGNEYVTAHVGYHHAMTKDDYGVPTYLLDKKYSMCEGQIAWSKHDKNEDYSIWLEFYSGEDLIYSTEPMVATDRALSFSFPVKDLETLTIVTNSTLNIINQDIYIIYPYLNLVE